MDADGRNRLDEEAILTRAAVSFEDALSLLSQDASIIVRRKVIFYQNA